MTINPVVSLTIEKGKLQATFRLNGQTTQEFIESKAALVARLRQHAASLGMPDVDDLTVVCSSSLDFPREYTENLEVIALCDAIRGG